MMKTPYVQSPKDHPNPLSQLFGQIDSLMFLTLQNNPNLVSLPESLADLDFLELISLSGSNPNVQIPERLRRKMMEEGDGFYHIDHES